MLSSPIAENRIIEAVHSLRARTSPPPPPFEVHHLPESDSEQSQRIWLEEDGLERLGEEPVPVFEGSRIEPAVTSREKASRARPPREHEIQNMHVSIGRQQGREMRQDSPHAFVIHMMKETIGENEIEGDSLRGGVMTNVRLDERPSVSTPRKGNVSWIDFEPNVVRVSKMASVDSRPAADVQNPPGRGETTVTTNCIELLFRKRRLPEPVRRHDFQNPREGPQENLISLPP